MARGEALYARLPVPLQHAAATGYGLWWHWVRQGGPFTDFRQGYLDREHFSEGDWRRWQQERLREIVAIATRAPYYRRLWGELGFSSDDIESFDLATLERVPPLEKDDIRKDPSAFLPDGHAPRGTSAWYTSGSTGTPLTVFHSRNDLRRGLAMRDARYRGFVGVDHDMAHATFRGRVVVSDPDSTGPFHRLNLVERQIYFSPYHLSRETFRTYIAALWRHRPEWFDGYATSIHDLAHLALEEDVACPPLRAVITTAEPSSERLREDVRRAFGCAAIEDYGMLEESAMALECENGSLHLFPDVGYVEILDESGNRCAPGEVGEIVATGLLREAQPFLRYRTGDMAAWATEQRCGCGRSMPVLEEVQGRVDDVLVGADGRRLGRLSTVPKHLPGVVLMQFVQEEPGDVLVRVVAEGRLEEAVRDEIERRLVTRLGSGNSIRVEQVDDLERTPRGKVRMVVSSVAQRR